MSKPTIKPVPPKGARPSVLPSPYIKLSFLLFCMILAAFAAPALVAVASLKFALLISMPEGQKRSGKSGTVVWKRNNQMRVFAFPRLVRNTFTVFIRSLVSNFSSGWNFLTQSQQDSWLNMIGYEKTDRLGNKIQIKGKTLYVAANTNLGIFSIGSISTALPPIPIAVFSSVPAAITTGTSKIQIAPLVSSILWGIKYWATPPVSAGTNRPGQNKFRMFAVSPDSTAPIADTAIYAAYVARFGAPVAGETVFIYGQMVGIGNGQDGGRGLVNKVIVT